MAHEFTLNFVVWHSSVKTMKIDAITLRLAATQSVDDLLTDGLCRIAASASQS